MYSARLRLHTRAWRLGFGKLFTYYSIRLISHIEPIILSKVTHYSQIILNSEIIVYKNDVNQMYKNDDHDCEVSYQILDLFR